MHVQPFIVTCCHYHFIVWKRWIGGEVRRDFLCLVPELCVFWQGKTAPRALKKKCNLKTRWCFSSVFIPRGYLQKSDNKRQRLTRRPPWSNFMLASMSCCWGTLHNTTPKRQRTLSEIDPKRRDDRLQSKTRTRDARGEKSKSLS